MVYVLFPSDYSDIKKINSDMKKEYEAVLEIEPLQSVFFGCQQWFEEGKLVLSEIMDEPVTAVYRGWAMEPKQYERFYHALAEKNITLITKPAEYASLYVSTTGNEGTTHLPLKKYGGKVNKWRVFYHEDVAIMCFRNSDQPSVATELPKEVYKKRDFPYTFCAVDYAELMDGTWEIVKIGEGQLSELEEETDYVEFFDRTRLSIEITEFFAKNKFCFNEKIENLPHLRLCAETVGIKLYEMDAAYDMYGNKLQDCVAIYANQDTDEMGILYELSSMINHEIRKQLRDLGIDGKRILEVMPDSCTWEKYFPELKGKMKSLDVDKLYKEAKEKYYRIKAIENQS